MGRKPQATVIDAQAQEQDGGFARQAPSASVPATRSNGKRNALAPMGHDGPPTPADMMMEMIRQGASIEVIERGQALLERWQANEARKAFNNAVANVKPNLPTITKGREVDFTNRQGVRTNYMHEDMAQIAEAINPVLAKEGLGFRYRASQDQQPLMVEGKPHHKLTVTCVLFHRDGHEEEVPLFAYPDTSGGKNGIQGIGSSATYLERYTIKLALGLAAAEDDDGEASEARSHVPSAQQAQQPKADEPSNITSGPTQPFAITVPKGGTAEQWCELYIANVRSARTVAQIEAWDAANDKTLERIQKQYPHVHTIITNAVQGCVDALAPKKPAPAAQQAQPEPKREAAQNDPFPTLPDPESDYDAFIVKATESLKAWTDPDTISAFWNERIEGASLEQVDRDDLMSAFRAAERRMEA